MTEKLPARIAFTRLAMETADEATFLARLASLPQGDAVRTLGAIYPDGWRTVRQVLAAVDHSMKGATPTDYVRSVGAMFDRAATLSPEASVALHSLGDPVALEAATTEIVDWLSVHTLLAPDARVLDFGCGIGRLEPALAGRVAEIFGIDVSSVMLAEARRRCADLTNVWLLQTSGMDLAPLRDTHFNLVVAVDSFPYVIAAGGRLAARLFEEIGRVLMPGGHAAIFNYAYQGSLQAHIEELTWLGDTAGLEPILMGEQPFEHWDGRAFLLRRS